MLKGGHTMKNNKTNKSTSIRLPFDPEKAGLLLDIIVPHYKEPWSVGKPLFDMLSMQHGVSFKNFRVILVEDGDVSDHIAPEHLNREYKVIQIGKVHQGVSGARNTGRSVATAPWVCFCDFDDCFLSLNSLNIVFQHLVNAGDKVYLWNRFIEEGWHEGKYVYCQHDFDSTFIHGRFINREFLSANGIWFDRDLTFGEDCVFNEICQIIAGADRIGEIEEPVYLWCDNKDSVTRRVTDRMKFYSQTLKHRFTFVSELKDRGLKEEMYKAVARVLADCYYEQTGPKSTNPFVFGNEDVVAAWIIGHADIIYSIPGKLMTIALAAARQQALMNGFVDIEYDTLDGWVTRMIEKYGGGKGDGQE